MLRKSGTVPNDAKSKPKTRSVHIKGQKLVINLIEVDLHLFVSIHANKRFQRAANAYEKEQQYNEYFKTLKASSIVP